ncbi:hypothetical protein GCM10011507_32320 [Edaphobacter acidisoli]|uniref:Uncharacterized protein n=1 Tax=Edaphobacter acidisoli TaxID=2040573 RepID=A0A916S144_9BACT|nr:hypothetical protein GCM10011507_32320 [Edaphobacter acidisoli]
MDGDVVDGGRHTVLLDGFRLLNYRAQKERNPKKSKEPVDKGSNIYEACP